MNNKDHEEKKYDSESIKDRIDKSSNIMKYVYLTSFVLVFIFAVLIVFASLTPLGEMTTLKFGSNPDNEGNPYEFNFFGLGLFISSLPIIWWAFGLFWKQEKLRKAKRKLKRQQFEDLKGWYENNGDEDEV